MKPRTLGVSVLALLLIFGGQSARAAPAAAERELKDVIVATFTAFAAFRNAIGMPGSAAKDTQNANCVSSARCGLDAALDQLRASAEVLRDELRGLQADENRLGGPFGKGAADALYPAAETLSRWNRLAASRASSTQPAASRLPSTIQAVSTAVRVAVDYLRFSGVATQPLEALVAANARAQ
jgi:hypothetical protein